MRRSLVLVPALFTFSTGISAQISWAEYAARRDSLVATMQDGVLLALGARDPKHDYLHFYQASPFYYLTGVKEPNAALVIVKQNGTAASTLFVQPREPAREVWTGSRLGTAGATKQTGIPARTINQLQPVLDSLLETTSRLYVIGDLAESGALSPDAQLVEALRKSNAKLEVIDLGPTLDRLRGLKSPAELALIRRAADITTAAMREAIKAIEPGMNEFEIQALIEYTFRRNGADRPAFASIVASGPNSTTLHYNTNDRFMRAGEVVVMDIGASYRGYAADVTRTVPVSGAFSPEQRAIYEIVRAAQAAAERQAKPGAPAHVMEDSARVVLARGLAKLGLIESPDAVFDAAPGDCGGAAGAGGERGGCPQWYLYYMHGLGHGIGLDVHDPEQFYYPPGRLAPGSAFTIEPGIYVRASLLDILPDTPRNRALIARIRPAVQRYRNIGVRIEDDYIVTERGVEWISRVPREPDEIESLMRERYAGPAKRNPAMVDWYRETGATQPR